MMRIESLFASGSIFCALTLPLPIWAIFGTIALLFYRANYLNECGPMKSLKDQINSSKVALNAAYVSCKTLESLEAARVTFMGRSGHIVGLMDELKKLSLEEKREVGPLLNDFKIFAENLFVSCKEGILQEKARLESQAMAQFDVTAYTYNKTPGSLHVYTRITNELEDIFTSMGYELADGPELETEFYNFDALNIPASHPARDMFDTIWIADLPNTLLRTHTSPVQVRAMQAKGAPLAVFAPGRVYRHEATDATHEFMFSQIEGLLVDKNISIAHLLATTKTFLAKLFDKKNIEIRVRPSFFPFVEPALEIDVACPFCSSGCSICKHSRFIEIMGAGLVHPHVLKSGGINPDIYSGFAFGFGLERLSMIRYGINDIRLFHENKLSFLEQF